MITSYTPRMGFNKTYDIIQKHVALMDSWITHAFMLFGELQRGNAAWV